MDEVTPGKEEKDVERVNLFSKSLKDNLCAKCSHGTTTCSVYVTPITSCFLIQ